MTDMRKWTRTVAVACMVGALAMTAASTAADARGPSAAKPVKGGTLDIGITTEVASLDNLRQFLGGISTGNDRAFLIYGTLMKRNTKTAEVIPGLAQSLETTDGQTWTLKLRPNLKFSDGTPLDADAVIFNFERFKDPANAFPGATAVNQIAKMTRVDASTVEFRLLNPNGSFGITFTEAISGYMGSPTAIKANPVEFGRKPVGAGPFMVQEWVRDRQLTLVRNPNYWDQPRPYLDQIVFRVLPDQTTMANALRSGEIDVAHVADGRVAKVAQENPDKFRSYNPSEVSGSIGMVCNLQRSPCDDVRYRQALSLSFDFKLAKQVFLDPFFDYPATTLRCMPWGPGSPYCAKDVQVKYNPEKAKKLIDEVKADGINTDLTYLTIGPDTTHVEWVQQQLAKVGVKLIPQIVLINDYVALQNNRQFQASQAFQPPATDMAPRFYNDWHSLGGSNGGRDLANLNNSALDAALEQGRNSVKLDDQIAGYQKAQRIIAKDFLLMWMYPQVLGVVSIKALQLPSYVNPSTPSYRYDEAWIKGTK